MRYPSRYPNAKTTPERMQGNKGNSRIARVIMIRHGPRSHG